MVFDFGQKMFFSGTFYFHTMNNFNMGEFFFELRGLFSTPPLLGTFICQLLGV